MFIEDRHLPDNQGLKKEAKPFVGSNWQDIIVEGMHAQDVLAIGELRSFFVDRGIPQVWYYAGAGVDVSPIFIAPIHAEHWFIDPRYNEGHKFYDQSFLNELFDPYRKLGVDVTLDHSRDQASGVNKWVLLIDGNTRLRLIGGKTQDSLSVPQSVDVVYTNPYSTSPGPDSLSTLRVGGLFVAANDREKKTEVINVPDKTIDDFGFRLIKVVKIENYHFNRVGKIRATTEGETIYFNIYEKTRSFSTAEKDQLQLGSSLWEFSVVFRDYVLRYEGSTISQQALQQLEIDLKRAIQRYFARIAKLGSSGDKDVAKIQLKIAEYFESDEELPRIVKNNSIYRARDPQRVQEYYSQAKRIYQEIKQSCNLY